MEAELGCEASDESVVLLRFEDALRLEELHEMRPLGSTEALLASNPLFYGETVTQAEREQLRQASQTSEHSRARVRVDLNARWVELLSVKLAELRQEREALEALVQRIVRDSHEDLLRDHAFVKQAQRQLKRMRDAQDYLGEQHHETRELALSNQSYLLRQLWTLGARQQRQTGHPDFCQYREVYNGQPTQLWPEDDLFQTFQDEERDQDQETQ